MYKICQQRDRLVNYRYRDRTVSRDKFISDLWAEILVASVVWRTIPNKITEYRVGFLTGYNANFRSQKIYLSVIAFLSFINSGLLFAGIELFIDNIFNNWLFRKYTLRL